MGFLGQWDQDGPRYKTLEGRDDTLSIETTAPSSNNGIDLVKDTQLVDSLEMFGGYFGVLMILFPLPGYLVFLWHSLASSWHSLASSCIGSRPLLSSYLAFSPLPILHGTDSRKQVKKSCKAD